MADRGHRPIYMDHNATTPVLPEVVSAMMPYFMGEFGNPSSSTHEWGHRAASAVEEARESVAALLGAADPRSIVFTAGATESNNLALRGVFGAIGSPGGGIVTCATEHEAVLETCAALEKAGAHVVVLPVDAHGLVAPDQLEAAISSTTLMVSVMMANNEIGTVQPIAAIGEICRRRGVVFHTDAVQGAGRIPIDVNRTGVDLVSITAHKMYGPKGTGALYVRPGVKLAPVLTGGGQEGGLRSGTLNVPGIVGFGAAARIALKDLHQEAARERLLRDRLWELLRTGIDDIELNGHPDERLPNNLNVAFYGIEADALLTSLRDVAALSAGSACASGTDEGSYVIRAISHSERRRLAARSSIRFGIGRGNDLAQIERVAEAVARQVRRLRSIAPNPRTPL